MLRKPRSTPCFGNAGREGPLDRTALRDLDGILGYVAKRDAGAAKRLAERIARVISRLERHPFSARGRKSDDCRILVIPGTRYDEVQILQLLHTARNFPR